MSRHALVEDYSSRDVTLFKGELVIVLDHERGGEGSSYSAGYHHLLIKTRHGRKVRVPRFLLSQDLVMFVCQICDCPAMPTYRDYVNHLIDHHLRAQLLQGLVVDTSSNHPTCPFPSCTGMNWPIVDNLLYHYATHHNVLDKVLMYESEVAASMVREQLRAKDRSVEQLLIDNERLRGLVGKDIEMGLREVKETEQKLSEEKEKEVLQLKSEAATKNMENMEFKAMLMESKSNYDKLVDNAAILKETLSEERKVATESRAKIAELTTKVRRLQSEVKMSSGEGTVSSSGEVVTCNNNCTQEEVEDLKEKVDRMADQNEAWQKQTESLQLEIENVHLQNENLKNIIELGKSTVEAAKNISHELSEENKVMKEREKQTTSDLLQFEGSLKQLQDENNILASKCENLKDKYKMKVGDVAQLQDRCQAKTAEIQHLQDELKTDLLARSEQKRLGEKCSKQTAELEVLVSAKNSLKQKLAKCREELDKKENEHKALSIENRNATDEIKTLKNHLNSNRAILVEKAVVKDELRNLRTELTSKSVELEDANVKLKKLSSEFTSVLADLKKAQDGKSSGEKLNQTKVNVNDADAVKNLQTKLTHKSDEKNKLLADIKSLKEANECLKERIESYTRQCSEYEITVKSLNEEILGLESSMKETNKFHEIKFDELVNEKKNIEAKMSLYVNEKDFLLVENDSLKKTLEAAKNDTSLELDAVNKYNLQCGVVEELLKKHEKLSAQLRRKDWEIDNYQRKLDSAFEAEMMVGQYLPPPDGLEMEEFGQPEEEEAIDLSKKNPEDGIIDIKVENEEDESHKRRDSQHYVEAHGLNQPSVSANLDTSHESSSTCPFSEVSKMEGPSPSKIFCARLVNEG